MSAAFTYIFLHITENHLTMVISVSTFEKNYFMKKYWIRKIPFVIAIAALGITAFSGIVMLLWNNVLAAVLHVSMITFWQAAGILLLSKILFSGFKGRRGMGGMMWKKQMFGKWESMTDEEKEVFRGRMQHCYAKHGC